MTTLIFKMVFCLVAALLLGLLIGWLLSKAIQSKRYLEEIDRLRTTIEDRNAFIIELEKKYDDEKLMVLDVKDQLLEKTDLVESQSTQLSETKQALTLAQSSVHENLDAKVHNHALIEQIHKLEKLLQRKEVELKEFERVLVKAEETIEEKENLFATINHQVEELSCSNEALKRELKLYSVDGAEDEFIISKDQFTHIENQLVAYQKEIDRLNRENRVLSGKSKDDESKGDSSEASNMDDTSIVKLFRDTYKKITKS